MWKVVAVAALIPAVGYPLYLALRNTFAQGELGEKAGWAALQGVELQTRGADCDTIEIRRAGDAFLAIGFPAVGPQEGGVVDQSCRSWILLNEHAVDREVKQMPRFFSYRLPCTEVAKLERPGVGADRYVLDHLRTICTP